MLCSEGYAQTKTSQIARPIDSLRVQVLPNHHPQWANASNSIGQVSPNLKLNNLTLVLSRSPQQQAAFEQFLADQQNPASSEYHHWLTPVQVGERFGLSAQDVETITGWLQSQGLSVNWVSPSRMFIGFGGTAADINRAFQTELHTYLVNNTERFSVSSDPVVPTALAPAIKAIRGLYTIEDNPTHRMTDLQTASPEVTSGSGNHYIGPADFATIYDLPSNLIGGGYTIGIVGRSRTYMADFQNFMSRTNTNFLLPKEIVPTAFGGVDPGPAFTSPPPSGTSIGDQSEATLDVLRAGSTAPGAQLLLVVATQSSGGIETDAQYLVQTSPVPAQVMTISFGACESAAGKSGVDYWDALFQQAAAEGISTFVSSGDSGASGCDVAFDTPPASPSPNSPNYICSSSYVTCVGGTEFNDANASLYWNSSNSTGLSSARSYIPEGAWNEPLTSSAAPMVASSGGGISAYIATPTWQQGNGVPSARAGRYTPDVSFSGSCHDGYFACFAAGGAGCVTQSNGGFTFTAFCGTSASAPGMAGVAAILDQKDGAPQGNLNPGLYATAASAPAVFHDVTVASSGVSGCNLNTPSICNNSIPSSTGLTGGQAGYLITDGYDLITGLGSIDINALLNSFQPKIIPTVTVTPSATNINVFQSITVAVTVSTSGSNPTPTGTVTLNSGTITLGTATLSSGSATFSIPAGTLPVGTSFLSASYAPDSGASTTYTKASGSNSVTISQVKPVVTVTLSSYSITTAQNLTMTISVSGGSGNPTPTGNLTLYEGYSGSVTLTGGSATIQIPAGWFPPGYNELTVDYTPDSQSSPLYSSAYTSSMVNVTTTAPNIPNVKVTPSYTNVTTTQTLSAAISVSGASGLPVPTGSITLVDGSYSSTATALIDGGAVVTIPAGALATGSSNLTAVYAPDTASMPVYINRAGSNAITVWNVAKSNPVIGLNASSTGITTDQPFSVTVQVGGDYASFPTATGTVALSSGTYSSNATLLVTDAAGHTSATFNIPANTLPVGTATITASYTPDDRSSSVFFSGSNSITVGIAPPANSSFSISGTSITVSPGSSTGNSSTITLTPSGGFVGNVTLTAAVSSSPAGAQHLPTITFAPTNLINIAGTNSVTATLTISTTPPSTTALLIPQKNLRWYSTGGVTLICMLICIPSRRRWHTMLTILVLLVIVTGCMVACGGGNTGTGSGGGGGSTGGYSDPGTTKGTYTITVTGTSGSITQKGTISLVVQ